MTNQSKVPSGLEALQQGRYAEAVDLLEMFCQLSKVNQEYWEAQKSLVQAYQGNGQHQKAIALCQKLLACKNPEVQAWARQTLPNLAPNALPQASTTPTTEAQAEITTAGNAANVGIKMKNLFELKSFYQHNLLTELEKFEAKRKAVIKQIAVVSIIILGIIFVLTIYFIHFLNILPINSEIALLAERSRKDNFFLFLLFYTIRTSVFIKFSITFFFLLSFIGCMWFWVMFYSSSTEAYVSGFKSKVIQKIIDFIDENNILKYTQHADTDAILAAFLHSQIYQGIRASNKISQDDCVYGKICEIDIFFSEIRAEVEIAHNRLMHSNFMQLMSRHSELDNYIYIFCLTFTILRGAPYIIRRIVKGQRINYQHFEEEVLRNLVSRKTVFKGLFFQADFNKKFKGKTVVLPAVLDYKIQVLNQNRGQVIKLEDPEFSNLFVVYGNDQVEARYILSTSLMEKLVRFRKKARRNIYVSFVESKIYIAVEYAEDLFEPLLFKSMLSFARIREYFEILQLMIGVVEELNLNRRIWSK